MEDLKIYRKRLIPSECIWLKDDIVLLCNEEFIVTRWTTLRPRKDFSHGSPEGNTEGPGTASSEPPLPS